MSEQQIAMQGLKTENTQFAKELKFVERPILLLWFCWKVIPINIPCWHIYFHKIIAGCKMLGFLF